MSTLCQPYRNILEAYNLFDFAGSQLERNLSQHESYFEFHHNWFKWYLDETLDLDVKVDAGTN